MSLNYSVDRFWSCPYTAQDGRLRNHSRPLALPQTWCFRGKLPTFANKSGLHSLGKRRGGVAKKKERHSFCFAFHICWTKTVCFFLGVPGGEADWPSGRTQWRCLWVIGGGTWDCYKLSCDKVQLCCHTVAAARRRTLSLWPGLTSRGCRSRLLFYIPTVCLWRQLKVDVR